MKHHSTRFFRVFILFLIGSFIISCAIPSAKDMTTNPTNTGEPVVIQPTNTEIPSLMPTVAVATDPPLPTVPAPTIPIPTNPPAVVVEATPTEILSAPDFFSEEFEGDLTNWEYFFMSGEEDEASFYTEDGKLKFYLDGEDIYAYLLYSPYFYEDVALTVIAENRGYNNNNVSLICRYDPEEGWYEFNIANNGLYWIYFYDLRDPHYKLIADGGSTAIHTGKDINEYSVVCNEKTLILYINGVETRRLEETQYVLKEGQVGVSVSSFSVYPIEVDIESVTIDYP